MRGALLGFTVWEHLPLLNTCMFYVWHIRSFPDPVTSGWTEWKDRQSVYGGSPRSAWIDRAIDVTDLLVASPDSIQIALGFVKRDDFDFCSFGEATPSPTLAQIHG